MNERNIIETQPERTDLPLIVIPVIVESMIEPFAANFPLLCITATMPWPSTHSP